MGLKTLGFRIGFQPPRVQEVVVPGAYAPGSTGYDRSKRVQGRRGVDLRRRWLEAHPLCVKCDERGVTKAGQEVDHILPLWQGGKDDASNKQTLCTECHAEKTAREAAQRYTDPQTALPTIEGE